jgi:hypothetical protein
MRGTITISTTRDDEKTGEMRRHHKTLFIESRGHDSCKAQGFIEELNDRIQAVVDDIDELKICSSDYTV